MRAAKKFDHYTKAMEDIKQVKMITCEEAQTISQRIIKQDTTISERDIIQFTEHVRKCEKCQ